MKKAFLLATVILFSSSVFAQSATISPPVHTPGLFERIMNTPITKETMTTGAKRLGGAMVAKKTRMAVGLGGTLVLAGVGYSAYEIKEHPEKIEFFLEGHPDFIPTIDKYVSQYDWGQKYLYNIGVGISFTQDQLDLEQTQQWQIAKQQVETTIVAVADNKYDNNECNDSQYVSQIWSLLLSQPDIFNQSPLTQKARLYFTSKTSKTLDSTQIADKSGVSKFDVYSYYEGKRIELPKDGLDLDHLPAKSTIRDFFEDTLNRKLTGDEVENLYYNTTIMAVTTNMHKAGRTWFNKNNDVDLRLLDARDLRETTIKDFANHFLYLQATPKELNNFIKSAIIVWNRNKALCLYR